jgi:phosphopantothenoylcysteine decarboxylase
MDKKKNLLIGCTGSVATVRIDQIIQALKDYFNLKIILTDNSKVFADQIIINYEDYENKNDVKFYFDDDEYKSYKNTDTVLHIEVVK